MPLDFYRAGVSPNRSTRRRRNPDQIIDGAALEAIPSWEWLAAITQDVDDKVHPK
jgi:hypothetical protein